jgi:hypothetical protein
MSTSGFSTSRIFFSQIVLRSAYSTVERRTSSVFSPSLQGDSSCTIANEFQDDLIDDGVRKGRKVAERSAVSARKTVMTWRRR